MHSQALLEACTELVSEVLRFEHPADSVVSRFFRFHRSLGPRERATLAETAYEVLRRKLLFEQLARNAGKGAGPVARRLAILGFHGDRDFLKSALSAAERDWLDACDRVDRSQWLEPHRHNLPAWLAQALKAEVGEDFWPLVESLNEPAPLDLRVNALLARRDAVMDELNTAGLHAEPTPWSPWGLRLQGKPALNRLAAFAEGRVEVQDEGSQLLALMLDARRGEMVVDFCAGAGGKTLAIGAAMRNTGRLYAFDTSAHRLDALKPRLARSGLSNVHPAAIAHERDDRVRRLAGKIDRVLVDAPCSGLGTLRRNPDLKWRQSPESLAELAIKQRSILDNASRLLKPGGRLVYATCSLLGAENEAVAQAFGQSHPEFEPADAAAVLAALKLDGAPLVREGCLRLWPHRHATDGFFAAVWRRRD